MDIIRNVPFVCIVLCMVGGIVSSALHGKQSRVVYIFVNSVVIALSAVLLFYVSANGESFTFSMGVYPAPWGNEVRAGILEALLALQFSVIMLLSVLGGSTYLKRDIEEDRLHLYYVFTDLLLGSILALIYTNDLFTAYVFIEINTIAACGLIMLRRTGKTYLAAMRYMVMNLIGSGLFLFAIAMLYSITGQLLMVQTREAVGTIMSQGVYVIPFTVLMAMTSLGLAVKSGLFPFHYWMPGVYGYSTPASSAMLSGLVSKAYIFLLIKLFVRVVGLDTIRNLRICNVLFVLGIAAMIIGSVKAMFETDIRRMNAYSSVAQIGYIYMGIGLGSSAGIVAAVYHMLAHSNAKSLLFLSSAGLAESNGGSNNMHLMKGLGYKNRLAGVGFTVGALSLVGIPLFGGFVSKLAFAFAGVENSGKAVVTLVALAVSTLLNAMYYLRTVITIYTPVEEQQISEAPANAASAKPVKTRFRTPTVMAAGLIGLIIINFILGVAGVSIMEMLQLGMQMFE